MGPLRWVLPGRLLVRKEEVAPALCSVLLSRKLVEVGRCRWPLPHRFDLPLTQGECHRRPLAPRLSQALHEHGIRQ